MADLEQYLHPLKLSVVIKTSKEESIGIGSYASVYEVTVHGTLCAAKEMHPVLMNEANKRAFLSECVQSSRILHPNIVQFLGIYYPSPRARLPWLVMELMYISLRGLIEKYEKSDFPFHFKLSILMDTCNGLQFLHSQNIIHRDLSSNNILLTKHLVAKISDLGMAKMIPPGLQRHTQAPGTVVFMPPEALSVNPQYGKPIDVFSVGCVCMHMISMEWPIPLDRVGSNNVVLSEVQRREQYFTNLIKYPSLEQLVKECLQGKPELRPVIEEVTKSLNSISYDHQPHKDDNIIDLFTSAHRCFAQEEQIAQKDQQLISKDKQLIEKDKQLSKKDQQIVQKDQQLVEKDQLLVQKDQYFIQKDQQLVEKDRQLKQKDQILLELSNKALANKEIALISKLEDHRRIFIEEINTKLEAFEQATNEEREIIHKTINDLQLEVDKLVYYFKQQSQPQNIKLAHITKDDTQPMLEATVQNDKKHKNEGTNISKATNREAKKMLSTSAKISSLNPDVLALMQKTGVYQNSALLYDLQTATIHVDCDDATEKEKIKEEFRTVYMELMMGGKLKEYAFPVDDVQQANAIVDEYTKTFSHTYFRYDPEKKEIKCLSTDARQMQNVRRRLNSMKKGPKVNSVCIDLPKLSRRVTIKFGDIVEEEVDIIVNAANDQLIHAEGVAAAIDKASYGAVQQESNKIIQQTGSLQTGEAVITAGGGKLKCKIVIHAVGPTAHQHKDQCGSLLHTACVNSMLLAQHNKAKSISFPPISSGIFGVSKDLVANVMLSLLCSYSCSDPELLNDVRIVIIDEPTFDIFLKFFNKEKENLKLLKHIRPTEESSKGTATSHNGMQSESAPQLGNQKALSNTVCIDLPNLSRIVTLKFGDIVQEEVDVIVNSANMYLLHNTGVAAAIDKASGGVVQTESSKVTWTRKVIPTGNAVATFAGGALKCKYVIHAVGPIADEHKNLCGVLLKNACISAMNVAQNFKATSIAFPPISSENSGVPTELVAKVMLSTLCSYACSNPALLSDVHIVIIDKPTFDTFLNAFHRYQQNLQQINNSAATTTASVIKPSTFQYSHSAGASPVTDNTTKLPGHAQSVVHSQAVTQQPTREITYPYDIFNAQQTNPPKASQDSTGSKPKQENVKVILHSKYLPPHLAAGDKQDLLQGGHNSKLKGKSKENKNDSNDKTEVCPICFDEVKDKPPTEVTTCKHCKQAFCNSCLDEALKHKPYCPTCTVPLRKVTGNQPTGGTMTVNTYPRQKLPGYEQYGIIQIHYDIPSGTQGKEHPNPGQPYHGTSRTAYVPNSSEGRKVVRRLRKAFDARLIFTVGTSHTSGATNVVVWNDIHHKTSISGGPTNYGYPDPTYLSRVLEELAAKGITE